MKPHIRPKPACEHRRYGGGNDYLECIDCGKWLQPPWRRVGPFGETNLPLPYGYERVRDPIDGLDRIVERAP